MSTEKDTFSSGWRLSAADERTMLKAAAASEGVLVTNENFRDAASESEDFRRIVEERTLIFSYINDHFVPPDDPLGRYRCQLPKSVLAPLMFPLLLVLTK